MNMSGEYRIEAPIQVVWSAIQNPDVLRTLIPGCEVLEKTSDTEMAAKIVLKIGPVKAKFAGEVKFGDLVAPTSLKIEGQGKGGIAGFAKGGATVQLAQDGGQTVLTYEAQAQVGGKIAQLGSRLIQSTAASLADKFFADLKDELAGAERKVE